MLRKSLLCDSEPSRHRVGVSPLPRLFKISWLAPEPFTHTTTKRNKNVLTHAPRLATHPVVPFQKPRWCTYFATHYMCVCCVSRPFFPHKSQTMALVQLCAPGVAPEYLSLHDGKAHTLSYTFANEEHILQLEVGNPASASLPPDADAPSSASSTLTKVIPARSMTSRPVQRARSRLAACA